MHAVARLGAITLVGAFLAALSVAPDHFFFSATAGQAMAAAPPAGTRSWKPYSGYQSGDSGDSGDSNEPAPDPDIAPLPQSPAPSSVSAPSGTATPVMVAQNARLGAMLTDAQGMTLYLRKSDPSGGSSCTGGCATTWPPLTIASGALTLPDGATGTLATFARDDGSQQVSYNGMALYYYSGDKAPGDTNGQGLNNNWYVVAP